MHSKCGLRWPYVSPSTTVVRGRHWRELSWPYLIPSTTVVRGGHWRKLSWPYVISGTTVVRGRHWRELSWPYLFPGTTVMSAGTSCKQPPRNSRSFHLRASYVPGTFNHVPPLNTGECRSVQANTHRYKSALIRTHQYRSEQVRQARDGVVMAPF